MKTNNYLLILGNKIEKAYKSIEYGQYYCEKEKDLFFQELIDFCKENKDLEIKELNTKVDEKYGEYLKIYDQIKKEKQISTITIILVIFLILTIISIILGIVFASSFTSSIEAVESEIRYSF